MSHPADSIGLGFVCQQLAVRQDVRMLNKAKRLFAERNTLASGARSQAAAEKSFEWTVFSESSLCTRYPGLRGNPAGPRCKCEPVVDFLLDRIETELVVTPASSILR